MAAHSSIVGGSTAKRVIQCPYSVKAAAAMPPGKPSPYAIKGTLLHECIQEALEKDTPLRDFIGRTLEGQTVDEDDMQKLVHCMTALDVIDPGQSSTFVTEAKVEFGIPGVFGSCDVLMRVGDTAVVLDWKFGDGVPVKATNNAQLLFYSSAAANTEKTRWVFEGAKHVKLVIVQPFNDPDVWELSIDEWATLNQQFRSDVTRAVKLADQPNPLRRAGDWCRWCPAKPTCPEHTGEADRLLTIKHDAIPAEMLGELMLKADALEGWIADLREMVLRRLEDGGSVTGWKLVAKRATRKWVNEEKAKAALLETLTESDVMVTELISPATAEKLLKKQKQALPEGLVAAISSGHTLALESDPRPAIVDLGAIMTKALGKL